MQDKISPSDLFKLETYNYNLPPELIAQYPAEPRDNSRLLVLDKSTGGCQDRVFHEVIDYLQTGDILVINQTRVVPARLYACKDTGARIELLLLGPKNDNWEALVKPARRMKIGSKAYIAGCSEVEVEVVADLEMDGGRLLKFNNCSDVESLLYKAGHMPLPPYINRPDEVRDQQRYQTVYARESGSAAAPTAGLHFTRALLEKIKSQGINITSILLHVGLGTFRPVSSQDIREHHMHYEYYQVDDGTATLLNETRERGGSIIAVGTTVVRALETVYNDHYGFKCQSGQTNKFIYPGYEIKSIDKLITNFHLPGSSLMMLVASWAGLDNTRQAYRHAIDNHYRFFSYGDAMLIE